MSTNGDGSGTATATDVMGSLRPGAVKTVVKLVVSGSYWKSWWLLEMLRCARRPNWPDADRPSCTFVLPGARRPSRPSKDHVIFRPGKETAPLGIEEPHFAVVPGQNEILMPS